jgi:choline/glycine/proline betaine transport protein
MIMSKRITRSDEKESIFGLKVNGPVFFTSVSAIILTITFTLIYNEQAEAFFKDLQNDTSNNFGWLYIAAINFFLFFMIYIALSPYGKLMIGGKGAKPEFKKLSWFAMLFSAGMGIGLLYFAISEPLFHFNSPPVADSQSVQAASDAMKFTFLHWGLHPWAVYSLVGLSLAYFTYSRGLPLSIRSVFYPFLGDKIHGTIGDIIDIFAVLATLFGLATSLGFGVEQIAAGLNYVFEIDGGNTTQVLLISGITLVATISVILGVDKGVKTLSEWNIRIAATLLILVLILGPSIFIFDAYIQNIGGYFGSFFDLAFWSESYQTLKSDEQDWQVGWTVFYWGWWIAWSPFVGMFIARVSKGRTVREFIGGVLLVPTLLTFLWMTAFGSTSIYEVINGNTAVLDMITSNDISAEAKSLFVFFEDYPFTTVLNIVGIALIISFFVTSSDSGSLVIDSLTSGGKIDAPVGQRVFWALSEGGVAAVLLVGGGLEALQTASIITAIPFTLILTVMCYSLYLGLKEDYQKLQSERNQKEKEDYEKVVSDMIKRRSNELNKSKKPKKQEESS